MYLSTKKSKILSTSNKKFLCIDRKVLKTSIKTGKDGGLPERKKGCLDFFRLTIRREDVKILGRSCGCGGIGRLIGFRFQRASVQVRVLSSAPEKEKSSRWDGFFLFFLVWSRTRTYQNAARMSAAREGLTERNHNFRPFPGGNANRVLSSAPEKEKSSRWDGFFLAVEKVVYL